MDAVYLNGAKRRPVLLVAAVVLLLSVALAIGAPSVFAQVIEEGVACMEDTAGFGLQCTAEDIKIAGVYDLVILDDGCAFLGDTVDFTAYFTVELTAQARYDLGLWFGTGGQGTALNGTCAAATVPYTPDPPWLDLDSAGTTGDICGDIDDDHNPLLPSITLTDVVCVDDDNDGYLDLPVCTSWRQPGANEVCTSPLDAYPGSPSKCKCQPEFEVPIIVPPTTDIEVTKWCPDFTVGPSGEPPGYPYVIQVINRGEVTATGVLITDTLPAGLTVVGTQSLLVTGGSPAAQGSCSVTGSGPYTVTCSLGATTLVTDTGSPATTFWEVTINVLVDEGYESTLMANTVYASADEGDPDSNNNSSTCSSTTAVSLAYFQATSTDGGVLFEWQTSAEVGNMGFNLYVDDGQGSLLINDVPILSTSTDPLSPEDYVFVAEGVSGDTFYIEDVDIRGGAVLHGPFALGEAFGSRVVIETIDWPAIQAARAARRSRSGPGGPRRASGSPASSLGGPVVGAPRGALGVPSGSVAVATGNTTIEVLVTETGMQKVTYEALLDAGIDLIGASAGKIAVMNRGQQVPATVDAGGRFGPGASIVFFGEALDTLYTDTNVYQIVIDRGLAPRVDNAAPSAQVEAAAFYMATVEVENNNVYDPASSGDPWYDARLVAFKQAVAKDFSLTVDNYVQGAAPATLAVDMWGGTYLAQTPDHHVVVSLNGELVADETFDGLTSHPVEVTLSEGVLKNGANTLNLSLPHDLGVKWDVTGVESYAVTYPRAFVAQDGKLTFEAAGDVFRVEGLASADVVVYRDSPEFKNMSNPAKSAGGLTLIRGVEVSGSAGGYVATFAGVPEVATYMVSTEGALVEPEIRLGVGQVDITSGSAQYLIITHPDFGGALTSLVQAREAQGLSVKVVDVEQIYAQFGDSIFDPNAISAYIRHAAAQMGTEMVLLVGDDSYDYLGYKYPDAMSFIPSLYAATDSIVNWAPVDALYADVDGDRVPDLAIGRFPVKTVAELEGLIGKTLAYATKDYGQTSMFSADVQEVARSFTATSEALRAELPASWSGEQAYIDELGIDGAREALSGAMNSGVALTSYFGHSYSLAWSFENLFTVDDAEALINAGRPTVVTQWGCWNAYYVAPQYDSLSTKLLLSGDRGAAAALGAVTLTSDRSDLALGKRLMPLITQPGMTLGEAVLMAKADLAEDYPEMVDVILGWSLLGDPALVIVP